MEHEQGCFNDMMVELRVFFGMEDRLRGDESQDGCTCLDKSGCIVAVAAARTTKEKDDSGRCTSGRVMIAVDDDATGVVQQNGGEIEGGEGTDQ